MNEFVNKNDDKSLHQFEEKDTFVNEWRRKKPNEKNLKAFSFLGDKAKNDQLRCEWSAADNTDER